MKQLGVNQSELAKRMKVSKPYVTKVLHQDVNFSFRTAAKLAQALEMDFFPELRERENHDKNGQTENVSAQLAQSVRHSVPIRGIDGINQKVYNTALSDERHASQI